jgi:hypothetical protein
MSQLQVILSGKGWIMSNRRNLILAGTLAMISVNASSQVFTRKSSPPSETAQKAGPLTKPADAPVNAEATARSVQVMTIRIDETVSPNDPRLKSDDTIIIGRNGERARLGDVGRPPSAAEQAAFIAKINTEHPIVDTSGDPKFQFVNPYRPTAPVYVPSMKPSDTQPFEFACDPRETPKIKRIQGTTTPGSEVKIFGTCFGKGKAEARLTGSNIKGIARLEISSWSNSQIIAKIPTTPGSIDGEAQIQVISSNAVGSVGFPVQYTPRFGQPFSLPLEGCKEYDDYNNKITCGKGDVKIEGREYTGVLYSNRENKRPIIRELRQIWHAKINSACRLIDLRISGFQLKYPTNVATWFDEKTPNMGQLYFTVQTDTRIEKHWDGDIVHHIGFAAARANAECPEGVDP